jgi:hypothetical protein
VHPDAITCIREINMSYWMDASTQSHMSSAKLFAKTNAAETTRIIMAWNWLRWFYSHYSPNFYCKVPRPWIMRDNQRYSYVGWFAGPFLLISVAHRNPWSGNCGGRIPTHGATELQNQDSTLFQCPCDMFQVVIKCCKRSYICLICIHLIHVNSIACCLMRLYGRL